jgi:hypothetical protein
MVTPTVEKGPNMSDTLKLTDEDIETRFRGEASLQDPDTRDADGTDGDAVDGTDGDAADSDATDATDGDAFDTTDADETDA